MKPLLIALLIFCAYSISAQNQYIDSLKYQLAISKQDTTRVLLLSDLCYYYRNINPDSALIYGNEALNLARQTKFLSGEAKTLSRLSFATKEIGDLPKALALAYQALNMAKQYQLGKEIAVAYAMIGNVYYDLRQYPSSITYWKQGMKIVDEAGDKKQLAVRLAIIGEAYVYNNQLDSAKQFLQPAYQEITRLKMVEFYPYIYRYLGFLQDKSGNSPVALSYYRQAVQTALQLGDHRNAAINYNFIAEFYQKRNQSDSCIVYGQKALEQAKIGPFALRILESSTLLAKAYKDKRDFQQALFYHELMQQTRDNLFSAGNIQSMQIMIANEEKRQQEIEQAKIDYQNQIKQYGLLIGLGVVLVIVFLLYRNNRQKHEANQLLSEQKTQIEQALETLKATQNQLIQREKMASLGELTAGVAHEIQNPLNFVNNFSELSVDLIKELKEERNKGDEKRDEALEEELLEDLSSNQEKINHHGKRAASIVKGMLEHSKVSTGKKELTNINTLTDEYLRLSYHGIQAKEPTFEADLKTDFDENLPQIAIVPQELGRVLMNIFNNAFYAVNVARTGSPWVQVSTKKLSDNIEIKVSDNGKGIPENIKAKIFQPFFTTKPTGEGTGLGLSLSYDIINKGLGGTIKVESKEGEGSAFTIILPLK